MGTASLLYFAQYMYMYILSRENESCAKSDHYHKKNRILKVKKKNQKTW